MAVVYQIYEKDNLFYLQEDYFSTSLYFNEEIKKTN